MPTAVCPLLVLYATAGGASVHKATAEAPDARVRPLRTQALRLLTPRISGCDGLMILATSQVKFCWLVELYGLYPPVTHLPCRSQPPLLSQAKVPTTTTPPPSS